VLSQSGSSVRVLIIDDASPDETPAVAARIRAGDARVSVRRHEANAGHIASYNEGIEWANAKYTMILSADDYLLPDALSRAMNLMERYPAITFTFGRALILDESRDGNPLAVPGTERTRGRVMRGIDFIRQSGAGNAVCTPTVVVRTELQKRLGGYRGELPHSGDMEMWLRLAAHGDVGFVDAYQAVHRRHSSNMSLAYRVERKLPDLRQRHAAVECFLRSCEGHREVTPRLATDMRRSLANEAVGYAIVAVESGEDGVATDLCSFARTVAPDVVGSWRWRLLAWQRRLGPTAWRAVRPALEVARHGHRTIRSLAKAHAWFTSIRSS
jgi:hypothetical protein